MKKIRTKPMEHLKALREERGLSQMAIGMEVGVSASSIQQYEKGTNSPSVKVLNELANYFEVSLDYMYDRSQIRGIPDSETFLLVDKLERVDNEIIKKAIMDILNQIVISS